MQARRTMRRHVIVSQGGKTGAGGTYLRDQNVSDEVAEIIPTALTEVKAEPGTATVQPAQVKPKGRRPSVPPPTTPIPPVDDEAVKEPLDAPRSVKALRRWSQPKMLRLAEQEGIEAEGLDKDGLRTLLAAHLGLK